MDEKTLDMIHIRDLTCRCIVGIYPEERVNKQDVIINITLWADLGTACGTDRIEDTVDYKDVKKQVLDAVENSSFNLVERLAQAVADTCLADPAIRRVSVSIDKPGALRFAKSVAIEITREKALGG